MEKRLINPDFFDLKRLTINERHIKTKTANCEYVFDACIEAATRNLHIGIITEPGYSAHSGIKDFTNQYKLCRYYYDVCSGSRNLKEILIGFVLQDLPPFIKINRTNEDYLVKAIGHYNKHIGSPKKSRIMIIYSVENLKRNQSFGDLYKLSQALKGYSGLLISVNATCFGRLQVLAERYSHIKNFISAFDWRQLPPPDPKELGQHCIARGVLAKNVIDKLLNKVSDFQMLNREINRIREELSEKGYLQFPKNHESA